MESPRADDVARPASRAARGATADPRAVFAALDEPRAVWSGPDGSTLVTGGAAATLTADGPGRFSRVRAAATDLFDRLDAPDAPDVARPRLFGGFAFHDEHEPTGDWRAFPGARFVLPAIQVAIDDDGAWVTATATAVDSVSTTVDDSTPAGDDSIPAGDDPTAAGDDSTPSADGGAATSAAGDDRTASVADVAADRAAEFAGRLEDLPDPDPVAEPPGVTDRRRTTTIDAWRESVDDAVARIRAGDLRKVVLAQALECDLAGPLSPPDVLARLGGTYPDCYRFLLEPGENGCLLGATPERLVSLRGRDVETGALAGTTGRGDTVAEDEWLAEDLLDDEKNRHEHRLVAEAVREQLAPLAERVDAGETGIRKLATVQHLWTPVEATLDADRHVLDLVEALHPTPAVGGLPPERALETIRETERFDRGWYAAPVGWFDAAGDGTFAVAIRSALAHDRAATLFAGVGIVADSDPYAEWDEVELKFRPILDELERDEDC